jgi:hypothetical protein
MTPSLDLCINSLYEPGNIPADPGVPPVVPTIPQLYEIAATLPGSGLLRADAQKLGSTYQIGSTFVGAGLLSARGTIPFAGRATFAGAGSLSGAYASYPLDGLSGVTGAYSLSRDLLTSFVGGTRYTNTGTNLDVLNDQSGNARNLTTPGTAPLIVTEGANSRTACSHGAGGGGRLESAAGDPLSDFITASAGYVIIGIFIDDANGASATVASNDGIMVDASDRFGLFAKTDDTIQALNFNGTADAATVTPLAMATAYVVEWRHEGGTLGLRINGGTEATVASGNTSTLTGVVKLGTGNVRAFDGKIFEAAFFSTVPSLAQRDALAANFKAWIGA